ncbi:MAG TPA: hypothetical protein VHC90_11300, partial [Bryobacteraceae bacterium]|nr:hypothetical protein [Bryobacteraceae bacterium]
MRSRSLNGYTHQVSGGGYCMTVDKVIRQPALRGSQAVQRAQHGGAGNRLRVGIADEHQSRGAFIQQNFARTERRDHNLKGPL